MSGTNEQWLSFCTVFKPCANLVNRLVMVGFDVISDLGWSEPFNCIEKGEVHPWVSISIFRVVSARA